MIFVELHRVRTHRAKDKKGRYRWYNDYRLARCGIDGLHRRDGGEPIGFVQFYT